MSLSSAVVTLSVLLITLVVIVLAGAYRMLTALFQPMIARTSLAVLTLQEKESRATHVVRRLLPFVPLEHEFGRVQSM